MFSSCKFLECFITCWCYKCSRLILYVSGYSDRLSHFPKEPWFLLLKDDIRNQHLSVPQECSSHYKLLWSNDWTKHEGWRRKSEFQRQVFAFLYFRQVSISCISHLLTAEPWANNLASQDLTFLIYKMDIIFNIIDLVWLLWELGKKKYLWWVWHIASVQKVIFMEW